MRLHPRLTFDIAWRQLLSGAFGPPVGTESSADAARCIEDFWSGRDAVIGLSVRSLFDAILAELRLPKGSAVVASAINIEGMAQIAQAHGLRLVAVDIDPLTLAPPPGAILKACRRHDARICLIAQLYGAVSPISEAPELHAAGITVVEDAAQAFAGRFYLGDPGASISLFSFGPIKRATALAGGVALMRNDELAARVRARMRRYPALSETWFRRRALKYLLLKALSNPGIYGLLIRLLIMLGRDPDGVIGSAARGFSGVNLLVSIRKRPPRRLLSLLAARLKEDHDHQLRRSAASELELRCDAVARPVGRQAVRHAAWLAPLLFDEPVKVLMALRRAGFDATRGATSLRVLDAKAATMAADVMTRVLYLPHPAGLCASERARLYDVILSAVSDVRPAAGEPSP